MAQFKITGKNPPQQRSSLPVKSTAAKGPRRIRPNETVLGETKGQSATLRIVVRDDLSKRPSSVKTSVITRAPKSVAVTKSSKSSRRRSRDWFKAGKEYVQKQETRQQTNQELKQQSRQTEHTPEQSHSNSEPSIAKIQIQVVEIRADEKQRSSKMDISNFFHGQVFTPYGLDEHGQPVFMLRPEAVLQVENEVSVTVVNNGPPTVIVLQGFDGDRLRTSSHVELATGVQTTVSLKGPIHGHLEIGCQLVQ